MDLISNLHREDLPFDVNHYEISITVFGLTLASKEICGSTMKTQRVVLTGAVLARLFAACAEAEDSFDGVLFGKTQFTNSSIDFSQAVAHHMPKTSMTMPKVKLKYLTAESKV